MSRLKTGSIIRIRDNYYKVAVGKAKPSCVRCWFLSGMRWCCCLDGISKNHLKNMDYYKTLIDINEGQYFTIVPVHINEGI